MEESFSYNSFSAEFCQQVFEVLEQTGSIKAVCAKLPISDASMYRLLGAAVKAGALTSDERSLSALRRRVVHEVMKRHPHATIADIARLSGVSPATVYRAKK